MFNEEILMKKIFLLTALLCSAVAQAATTLESVQQRGVLNCGASAGLPGFSQADNNGAWSGIDVDLCRGIAAAIFNDASKVKFFPLNAKTRFSALQSSEIDLLSRNTTWTVGRDSALSLDFGGVTYYDGQGFIVRKKSKVTSAKKLAGAAICTETGTTTEQNLADYFRANQLKYKVVTFDKNDEALAAYEAGRCDSYTTDRSGLAGLRTKLKNPDDHIVLPEVISKEPLAAAVRHGDNQWGDIVRWTLWTMLTAEELGLNAANIDAAKSSTNPEVRRFVGAEGELGKGLGLPADFAVRIIKAVGNYGESYERNLGEKTPLKLARGLNNLWNKGGLQYAPPMR